DVTDPAAVRVPGVEVAGVEGCARRQGQGGGGEGGGIRQDVGHLGDIDVGPVIRVPDQPHRVAGHRIVHGGGSIVEGAGDVVVVGAQRSIGNPGGQVAGVDGKNLRVLGEEVPLGHVERFDHRISVEAEVAGIISEGGVSGWPFRGGDVVEP